MITLICGHTGSGKTFVSVKMLYKAWKKKENIFTNHALRFGSDEGIMRWHQLEETYHLTKGILFIDDAKKLLAADRWQMLPQSFKEKIAGHRHDHLDVITNIQDYYQINVEIRRNVHRLITLKTVLRSTKNDRIMPALQITRATEWRRKSDVLNERSSWEVVGHHTYYISRFFSKKLYDTFDNIYLDKFICKINYCKKPNQKKGEWFGKIYSRDLVNQGKARI